MNNPKLTEKANAIYRSLEEEPKKDWAPPRFDSGYRVYGLLGIPFGILMFMLIILLHSLRGVLK